MPKDPVVVNSCRFNCARRKGDKLKERKFGSCVCNDGTACANAGNPDHIKTVSGHIMMMCGRVGRLVTQGFAKNCRNRTHVGT